MQQRASSNSITALELVVIPIALAVLGPALLPLMTPSRRGISTRASCQNNLKQLGLICNMYAKESRGERYPPLSLHPDNWMMSMQAVYPEYISDLSVLASPDDLREVSTYWLPEDAEPMPECVTAYSYVYIGFAVNTSEIGLILFDFAAEEGWGALFGDRDMPVINIEIPSASLAQLSDAHLMPSGNAVPGDVKASMPIIWKRLPKPYQGEKALGGNVLYMDGHVDWLAYETASPSAGWPMNALMVETYGLAQPKLPPPCPEQPRLALR